MKMNLQNEFVCNDVYKQIIGSAAVQAMQAAVCGSAQGSNNNNYEHAYTSSARAVRSAVCGSVLGSVRQCAW